MRILISTQAVDLDDPVLGFFHRWLEEFSTHYESIHVICLKKGRYALPQNVTVHSLGKESDASRIKYILNFYRYIWTLRHEYDAVFVHMNQEYVLLGGKTWWLLRKPVYLWRNHYAGNFLTDVAVFFCKKVFCTSRFSYTAKFKKTILMPIGIDTEVFKPSDTSPVPGSILFLGRLAPSKRVEIFIEAITLLARKNLSVTADIYGDALPNDAAYRNGLIQTVKERGMESIITFHPGIPNTKTPPIYQSHEVYVNCSKSGMYDKTIFEAAACGALSIASSDDYAKIADPMLSFDGTVQDLTAKLEEILKLPPAEKVRLQKEGRKLAETNSLQTLGARLREEVH